MKFFNRFDEMNRLERLIGGDTGGLAVVWGRRRIGKTRLLLEWGKKHDGIYLIGDQSSAVLQRSYAAQAVEKRFPGFSAVEYPTWSVLFNRLAAEAKNSDWRGPLIIDELPFFVGSSPELPSQLQRWIDHEAREAGLTVALAGSSQRMMQGLVLDRSAPLFGRAREILTIQPLGAGYTRECFPDVSPEQQIELYTIAGGVPRYWELFCECDIVNIVGTVERLILHPNSPLHNEPDRLLLEELPSAVSLRPVLDAIGAGAHRVSEIAGRAGMAATSLSKPLARLLEMGYVKREISFGEPERSSKRALYKINDPFLRFWFRVVASNRSFLAQAPEEGRCALYRKYRLPLIAAMWEELCRMAIPKLHTCRNDVGCWQPAKRYWHGNEPEWDIVAEATDGTEILLGECKWLSRKCTKKELDRIILTFLTKGTPEKVRSSGKRIRHILFVNHFDGGDVTECSGVSVAGIPDVLGCLR